MPFVPSAARTIGPLPGGELYLTEFCLSDPPPVPELRLATEPLSRFEVDFPAIRAQPAVTQLRVISAAAPTFEGDLIAAQGLIDNVVAGPEPETVPALPVSGLLALVAAIKAASRLDILLGS